MAEHHHQGPYAEKPDFDPPLVENYEWGRSASAAHYRGWAQVQDGSWYAFYCNTGPKRDGITPHWSVEHNSDSNWWINPARALTSLDQLVCRHGAPPGACPDGSCGSEPAPAITEDEVIAAGLATLRLLGEMEERHEV